MRSEASGETVLLLHGGGVSGWMWRPVLDLLDEGIAAIVPDLPGHGVEADRPYVSHDETVHELVELIREAAPGGLSIVGFSLGAQLAILLASEHPELVRGVVAISGEAEPAPLPGATLRLLGWAAPLARRERFARLQARQLGVPDELLSDYVRDSRRMRRDTLLASVGENIRFTVPAGWGDFAGRVTVMVGAKERAMMRRSAGIVAAAVPGSELVVVPGAGHDLPFTRPDIVAGAIRTQLPSA